MSNTAALALIVTSSFFGFMGYIYTSRWAHEVATEIVTGTAHTAPLPLPNDWRGHLLYTRWIYLVISIVAWAFFAAAVNMRVASLASDAGVMLFAYFAAALGGMMGIGWLAHGSLEFLLLRRIFRSSRRNAG